MGLKLSKLILLISVVLACASTRSMADGCDACCGGEVGHKRNIDEGDDDYEGHTSAKSRKVLVPISPSARVIDSTDLDIAVPKLFDGGCVASVVKRTLPQSSLDSFAEYLETRPVWPDTDDYHPLEATHDRICVIDFEGVPVDHVNSLQAAKAYGRNLPYRVSPDVASGHRGIAEVTKVLPQEIREVVAQDAADLLLALHKHVRRRQYVLKLELVLGDTCQRWHADQIVLRSLVSYVGPGTLLAHEHGVTRDEHGHVSSVDEDASVQIEMGDMLFMKGGKWEGSNGRGVAHRAPPIGPKQACSQHRLVLKVDVSKDF